MSVLIQDDEHANDVTQIHLKNKVVKIMILWGMAGSQQLLK